MKHIYTFLLCTLLVGLYGLSHIVYAQSTYEEIVNTIQTPTSTVGEAYADSQLWLYAPDQTEHEYIFGTRDGEGIINHTVSLGTQIDQRDGCMQMYKDRRVGICEDGLYTIQTIDTDAAGNSSKPFFYYIERDTVAPVVPIVSQPYICGSNICLRVSGENNTSVAVNQGSIGTLAYDDQEFIALNNFLEATSYTFEIALVDEATNQSESVLLTYTTPSFGVGGGGDVRGTEGDPWGGKSGSENQQILIDVTIDLANQSYSISNIILPAPVLTYTSTSHEGNVLIYGYAIPKGHPIVFNISKSYASYSEAKKLCGATYFYEIPNSKCMEEKMGITLKEYRKKKNKKCGYFIPFYTSICQIDKYFNDSTKYFKENADQVRSNLQNSMVTFAKKNKNDEYLATLWNDAEDGRFILEQQLDDNIVAGDIIHTHLSIFGTELYEGIEINYRGVDAIDAERNMGLRSDWGRSLEVLEEPEDPIQAFFEKAVSPMSHSTCASSGISRGWNNPNWQLGHDGVDYTHSQNCIAVSVGSGVVEYTGWGNGGQGWYVLVNHQNGYYSVYMHGTGEFFVANGSKVSTGDRLMRMGNSGLVFPPPTPERPFNGTHTHWSWWDHKPWSEVPYRSSDPSNFFTFKVLP